MRLVMSHGEREGAAPLRVAAKQNPDIFNMRLNKPLLVYSKPRLWR